MLGKKKEQGINPAPFRKVERRKNVKYISYKDFKEIFTGAATAVLNLGVLGTSCEEVELRIETVNKNGQELTGVTLKPKKDECAVQAVAMVYLEELYEQFIEDLGKMDIEMPDFTKPFLLASPENKELRSAIVSFVASILKFLLDKNKSPMEKLGIDLQETEDMVFNHLLEHVELELHPARGNGAFKGCPHIMIGDIAVVYHCVIKRAGHEDREEVFHVGITDEILEKAGVTKDELHKAALRNTQERHPEVLTKINNGVYAVGAPGALSPAVAVFYPGVLKTIAARMGGNLHIIFLDDEHALVVQEDVVSLEETGKALIKTAELAKVFSKNIFRYDRYSEKLDVAGGIIHKGFTVKES